MTTLAIAYKTDPKRVALWCSPGRIHPNGTREFDVLHGAWHGSITPAGRLKVTRTKAEIDAQIVWEGEVPQDVGGGYNEAIHWIESQIA